MQEAAASRAARAPFVAHLCILELTGDSPIRVEPVSEDRVQDWRPPAPGVGGLPAVGGGTKVLRDLAQAGWLPLAACCPALPQHQQIHFLVNTPMPG